GTAHDRRTTSTVVAGPGRTGHCHGRRTTRPCRGRDGHRTTLWWVRTHPTAVVACRPRRPGRHRDRHLCPSLLRRCRRGATTDGGSNPRRPRRRLRRPVHPTGQEPRRHTAGAAATSGADRRTRTPPPTDRGRRTVNTDHAHAKDRHAHPDPHPPRGKSPADTPRVPAPRPARTEGPALRHISPGGGAR